MVRVLGGVGSAMGIGSIGGVVRVVVVIVGGVMVRVVQVWVVVVAVGGGRKGGGGLGIYASLAQAPGRHLLGMYKLV